MSLTSEEHRERCRRTHAQERRDCLLVPIRIAATVALIVLRVSVEGVIWLFGPAEVVER